MSIYLSRALAFQEKAIMEWKIRCKGCGRLFWSKDLIYVSLSGGNPGELLCPRCLIHFLGAFLSARKTLASR